jgi:hypothetical protein
VAGEPPPPTVPPVFALLHRLHSNTSSRYREHPRGGHRCLGAGRPARAVLGEPRRAAPSHATAWTVPH